MSLTSLPQGRLRTIKRDGEPVVQLQCPQCGRWGDIDDDQLHGRVSVDHTDVHRGETLCTFHETRDWKSTAEWVS
jgi:hypothetical protein